MNNTPIWIRQAERLPYFPPPKDLPDTWRNLTKLNEWLNALHQTDKEVK